MVGVMEVGVMVGKLGTLVIVPSVARLSVCVRFAQLLFRVKI